MRNIYEINLLPENERVFSLFIKSLGVDSDDYLSQVVEAYVEKNKCGDNCDSKFFNDVYTTLAVFYFLITIILIIVAINFAFNECYKLAIMALLLLVLTRIK